MLLKSHVLQRVARAEVRVAFRRWKKPTVKAGTRLHTSAGVLEIVAVAIVAAEQISDDDAVAAGYPNRESLLADLGEGASDTDLYRISFGRLLPDPRPDLGLRAALTAAEEEVLLARFARWERSAPGYWKGVLALIGQRPATAAAELADTLGVDRARLKGDVRRLKALGLTESLAVGYRLTPRGTTVLRILSTRAT